MFAAAKLAAIAVVCLFVPVGVQASAQQGQHSGFGLAKLNRAVIRQQEASAPSDGQVHQAAAPILAIPKVNKLLEMDFRRLLAWVGGLTIGNFALSGLNVPYVGLIGGALIGEYWYSNRVFPFDGTF